MNISNFFNGMFGKIKPGMCRMSLKGNIAVKCSNGYKTYNLEKERLTNVTNFCFDIGTEFFFVLPTSHVVKGDIILVDGKPKCVLETKGSKIITVIDYESSEIRQIVPERHIFMGSSYYYGKIVSMFGNNLTKKGSGIKQIMKMMMLSQMFGGNNSNNTSNAGDTNNMFSGMMGNMGQMMAMSMFMGGNGGEDMFSNMLGDFSFDMDAVDDDDDEESKSNTSTTNDDEE